jgi:hypothetical protein
MISSQGGRDLMAETLVAEVEAKARLALSASPVYALRELQVDHDGEALHLTGRVSCFYHKQLAQEAIRAIDKKVPLINAIDVQ